MNSCIIVLTKGQNSLIYSFIGSIYIAEKVITSDIFYQDIQNRYLISNFEGIDQQTSQYMDANEFIETNLNNVNVELRQSENGLAESILLAYFISIGYPMKAALETFNILGIQIPPEIYQNSLKKLYSITICENQNKKLRMNPQYESDQLQASNNQNQNQNLSQNFQEIVKIFDEAQSKEF